jgi:hypothetical protein
MVTQGWGFFDDNQVYFQRFRVKLVFAGELEGIFVLGVSRLFAPVNTTTFKNSTHSPVIMKKYYSFPKKMNGNAPAITYVKNNLSFTHEKEKK